MVPLYFRRFHCAAPRWGRWASGNIGHDKKLQRIFVNASRDLGFTSKNDSDYELVYQDDETKAKIISRALQTHGDDIFKFDEGFNKAKGEIMLVCDKFYAISIDVMLDLKL